MIETTNLGLKKPETSDEVADTLGHLGDDMDILDGMPLPIGHGSNSDMEYLKLANGVAIMWGRVDSGTSAPCSRAVSRGYLSADVTVAFPLTLVGSAPVLLAHATGDPWSDVLVAVQEVGFESATFDYWMSADDSAMGNHKACSIVVIGRWA